MDEIIKRITEKTGISEDQARSATPRPRSETYSADLKEVLPRITRMNTARSVFICVIRGLISSL